MLNAEKLQELAEELYDYTTTISITEFELFDNYTEKLEKEKQRELTREDYVEEITNEIKHDLLFNVNRIKRQLEIDIGVYEEETGEFAEIVAMYKKLKQYVNIEIEFLENF